MCANNYFRGGQSFEFAPCLSEVVLSRVSLLFTMLCGGVSASQPANEEIQAICDQVRNDVEGKAGRKFPVYSTVAYTSQVVAGTNFFVKIKVGEDEHIHVRIFRPLPSDENQELQLHSMQDKKTKDDPLEYF